MALILKDMGLKNRVLKHRALKNSAFKNVRLKKELHQIIYFIITN